VTEDTEEALLARIPPNAATLFRRAALHHDVRTAHELYVRALEAVCFPKGPVYPLPAELDGAQRALAELLARHGDLDLHPFAIPGHGQTRRRWLGLDEGGVLESVVVDGEPLWRALQKAGTPRAGAILDALSIQTMLEAIGEMFPVAYGLLASTIVKRGRLRVWTDLRDEGRDWAIEQAHKWSALAAASTPRTVPEELKALIFLALARAKEPIDPAWEPLRPSEIPEAPEPVVLACTEYFKPASARDLSKIQREQLRFAGKEFDGEDLDAEERLAVDGGESSFAGLIQFRTIADAGGKPIYDALLFMGDAGIVFETGTTDRVGALSEGELVVGDRALRDALHRVLYAPAPLSVREVPKKKPATPKKKSAPKAKPAPKKKTAARKKKSS
jgi:hypothetical protein